MNIIKKIRILYKKQLDMFTRLYQIQEALGRIECRQTVDSKSIDESEFKVFSQWGEDGIIQFLVNKIDITRKIFVEFGVENYTESNTRFLLSNNAWSGLVIDGDEENIKYIKTDPIYWASNLKAVHEFITRDNINSILLDNGIDGDIGILSIDIDGNDYWIWDAIHVISPRIVICEYNSHFGSIAEVTIPYHPEFQRENAHYSKIYYGASLSALNTLANKKGYALIATNLAGNNVFFVRNDLLNSLKTLSPSQAYRRSIFREFHDENGHLTYDDFETRLGKIKNLNLFDIKSNQVKQIFNIKDII